MQHSHFQFGRPRHPLSGCGTHSRFDRRTSVLKLLKPYIAASPINILAEYCLAGVNRGLMTLLAYLDNHRDNETCLPVLILRSFILDGKNEPTSYDVCALRDVFLQDHFSSASIDKPLDLLAALNLGSFVRLSVG